MAARSTHTAMPPRRIRRPVRAVTSVLRDQPTAANSAASRMAVPLGERSVVPQRGSSWLLDETPQNRPAVSNWAWCVSEPLPDRERSDTAERRRASGGPRRAGNECGGEGSARHTARPRRASEVSPPPSRSSAPSLERVVEVFLRLPRPLPLRGRGKKRGGVSSHSPSRLPSIPIIQSAPG